MSAYARSALLIRRCNDSSSRPNFRTSNVSSLQSNKPQLLHSNSKSERIPETLTRKHLKKNQSTCSNNEDYHCNSLYSKERKYDKFVAYDEDDLEDDENETQLNSLTPSLSQNTFSQAFPSKSDSLPQSQNQSVKRVSRSNSQHLPPLRQIQINHANKTSFPSSINYPNHSLSFSQKIQSQYGTSSAILSQSSASSYAPLQTPVRVKNPNGPSKPASVGKIHERLKQEQQTVAATPQAKNKTLNFRPKKRAWIAACIEAVTPRRQRQALSASSRRIFDDQTEDGDGSTDDYKSEESAKTWKDYLSEMTQRVQSLMRQQEQNLAKKVQDCNEARKKEYDEQRIKLENKISTQTLEFEKAITTIKQESEKIVSLDAKEQKVEDLLQQIKSVEKQVLKTLPQVNKQVDRAIQMFSDKEKFLSDKIRFIEKSVESCLKNKEEQTKLDKAFIELENKIRHSIFKEIQADIELRMKTLVDQIKNEIVVSMRKDFSENYQHCKCTSIEKCNVINTKKITSLDITNGIKGERFSRKKVSNDFPKFIDVPFHKNDQMKSQLSDPLSKHFLSPMRDEDYIGNNIEKKNNAREKKSSEVLNRKSAQKTDFDDGKGEIEKNILDPDMQPTLEAFYSTKVKNYEKSKNLFQCSAEKKAKQDNCHRKVKEIEKKCNLVIEFTSPRRSKRIKQKHLKEFQQLALLNQGKASTLSVEQMKEKRFDQGGNSPKKEESTRMYRYNGLTTKKSSEKRKAKKKQGKEQRTRTTTKDDLYRDSNQIKRNRPWLSLSSRKKRKVGFTKRAFSLFDDDGAFSFATPKRWKSNISGKFSCSISAKKIGN